MAPTPAGREARRGRSTPAQIDRSSLRLAFVGALQHLSACQRGALILRDVLDFSASETADILGISVASVNSSLQRARARFEEPGRAGAAPRAVGPRATSLGGPLHEGFRGGRRRGSQELLVEDVLMEMPPMLNWFVGPDNYGLFMDWVFERPAPTGVCGRWKPTASRALPPTAASTTSTSCTPCNLHRHRRGISRNSVFQDAEIFTSFPLASRLDAQGGVATS